MLQMGIHCAIVKVIVEMCADISTERKRVWSPDVGPIYDHGSWISAGKPHPTSSISRSKLPEVHPVTFLRMLKDFFDLPSIQIKLRRAITRGIRNNNDMVMGGSWLHREDSTMEYFNGRYTYNDTLHGGVSVGSGSDRGPASNRYLHIEGDENLIGTPEDINEYYKIWDCEGEFVHKRNIGIGHKHTTESFDLVEIGDGIFHRYIPHNFSPHRTFQSVYSDEEIHSDNHPHLLTENIITNLSKQEKLVYISMFLTRLCEEYDGEEGNSPVNRATWYEVSEFIKFYYDIWSSFDTTNGDDECWMESLTSGPMTYKNGESSTMYEIPGVWHPDNGGKFSQNFEVIMKLQVDDWWNSIWKQKYETYLQRIFEEEGIQLYKMIESERETEGIPSFGIYGETSDEELEETSEREESLSNRKIKSLMEYLFSEREKIPEGIYLELCNKIKEVHESL
jgi:hypothetical protein